MSIACFKSSERRKRNKRLWSCHGRTHTHSAHSREGCSIEHVFVRWNKTAGAAATGCIGSDLSWDSWRGVETGPRCRPRDMRCDIDGPFFHLRYTRLDPSGHGNPIWNGLRCHRNTEPIKTVARSSSCLSLLVAFLLSPTAVVDVQPRRIWDLQHAVACQRFFDPPSAERRVAMLVTSHMLWCYYCYSPRAAYILTP